jgi:DnaK suppressor protein
MIQTTARHAQLRDILTDRRLELQQDLRRRARNGRTDPPVVDVEASADGTDEVEFAMLQLQDDTLRLIDEALVRLDVNAFGTCETCGVEIPVARIRALPFAVRCRACEDGRDRAALR